MLLQPVVQSVPKHVVRKSPVRLIAVRHVVPRKSVLQDARSHVVLSHKLQVF